MQNSSISLYQSLLPGIGNGTLRMRYFGYYAWLCRSYGKYEGSEDPQEWRRFIRRAEALIGSDGAPCGQRARRRWYSMGRESVF